MKARIENQIWDTIRKSCGAKISISITLVGQNHYLVTEQVAPECHWQSAGNVAVRIGGFRLIN